MSKGYSSDYAAFLEEVKARFANHRELAGKVERKRDQLAVLRANRDQLEAFVAEHKRPKSDNQEKNK